MIESHGQARGGPAGVATRLTEPTSRG
jgi:hypothetical protein